MGQDIVGIVGGAAEEEQGWRELDGGRVARLPQAVLAFALVAVLAFGAGVSVGERGGGGATSAAAALPSAPVAGGGRPADACGSVPEGAWRRQLCPAEYPSGATQDERAATPELVGPACASLPDPAWRMQLCPSLYPGGRAGSGR